MKFTTAIALLGAVSAIHLSKKGKDELQEMEKHVEQFLKKEGVDHNLDEKDMKKMVEEAEGELHGDMEQLHDGLASGEITVEDLEAMLEEAKAAH